MTLFTELLSKKKRRYVVGGSLTTNIADDL